MGLDKLKYNLESNSKRITFAACRNVGIRELEVTRSERQEKRLKQGSYV